MNPFQTEPPSQSGVHRVAYRFVGFELHPGRQLLRDGSPVTIGNTAMELLRLLVWAQGNLVTKDELISAVWPGVLVVENALHQHIRALRLALGDCHHLIHTVPRRGYRFAGPVEEVACECGGARQSNGVLPVLPVVPGPLIGREDDVSAIESLLQPQRCLTLLGPGGVGKTRLALEVARRAIASASKLVYLAELAALSDGAQLVGAIASSIGLTEPSGLTISTRIRHALGDAHTLLVLDNCEHLIEAAAVVVRELLRSCPLLQVVATSQRPLHIEGEHCFQVPMLGLPPQGTSDEGQLAAAPAVCLLLMRVSACGVQMRFDSDALKEAAELCRQLDGNALAIEIAAPRVATLGLSATRAGLADRCGLFVEARRDALLKHQNLSAMMDWSHDLLGPDQQAFFRRLSVFAGGWTIASASEVVGAGNHDDPRTANCLAELVERSMITHDGATNSPRFRMLETQRRYASEKLRASGEHVQYQLVHAHHVCEFVEAGCDVWDRTPDEQWMARYTPERDNVRAAIRTSIDSGDQALAARLVGSSIWLWRAIGAVQEFQEVLHSLSVLPLAGLPSAIEARLRLSAAQALHATSTESNLVKAAAETAVLAHAGTQDALGAANAWLCLASAFAQLGKTTSHHECLDRVESLLAGHQHGKTFGWFCGSHAWAAQLAGELHEALRWAIRSRAAYRDVGGWHGEVRAMLHIADLKLAIGDVDGAIAVGSESVARLQGRAHRIDLGRALANLGAAWFERGDRFSARECWSRSMEALRGLDFSYWVFDHLALLAISEGRSASAACMVGYADAGYSRLKKGRRVQNEERSYLRVLAHLEASYDGEELGTLMFEGANASEEEMIAIALSSDQATGVPPRFAARSGSDHFTSPD